MDSNAQWAQRGKNAWMGGAKRGDLAFVSGSGSWLRDANGREYLDFVSGWAVCALGHAPREVSSALREQSETLVHCSPGYWNPTAIELAERLKEITGMDRVFLGCTGAEANECAIKLTRKWGRSHKGGAFRVVATWKGFHGRTLATMAATGKPEWQGIFGPACEGFDHVPFGDLEAMERAIGSETCAVMLEPVQGEGGVNVANAAYLRGVRELCDRHGVLFVADEVQTGLGRCGDWLACDALGTRPDIVTLGKGLGGGLPVSACATRAEIDCFEPGDQGGTFTYHPLGSAVALAVLDAIRDRGLLAAARERGAQVERILDALAPEFGIGGIRGIGLLRAFDLPAPRAAALVDAARERGLLLNAPRPSTVRLFPALTISAGEVEEFGVRLAASLADVSGG